MNRKVNNLRKLLSWWRHHLQGLVAFMRDKTWMINSLRKHPFLLALRRWGRFNKSLSQSVVELIATALNRFLRQSAMDSRLRAASLFSVVRWAKREICKWPRAWLMARDGRGTRALLSLNVKKKRDCLQSRWTVITNCESFLITKCDMVNYRHSDIISYFISHFSRLRFSLPRGFKEKFGIFLEQIRGTFA